MTARDSELLETFVGSVPEGWSLGHFTTSLRGDRRIPIEALRRGAFAVHEVDLPSGRQWRLSHAPSGLQIWTFPEPDQAIELAERIEPFTAWGEITRMLPCGTDLYPKVRAVIDDIEAASAHISAL